MSFNKSFAKHLQEKRLQKGLLARDVASKLNIDAALISRFETGNRIPSKKQVYLLAEALDIPAKDLMVLWLSEKIIQTIGTDSLAMEALALAEEKVQYQTIKPTQIASTLNEKLKQIDKLKKQVDSFRKNDNFRLAEALAVEYTYESNKIEGNTLSLQETSLVVNEGITISGKSMREHLEAINHYEAIGFIKDIARKKVPLTEKIILQLHHLVLRGIDKDKAGKYRNVQVRITGSNHVPPAPYLVPVKMEELFRWYMDHFTVLHPVLLAAEMHERLVSIHPFIDGNGRTSRLLMNLILLANGYGIANLKGDLKSRLAYYECLESARTDPRKLNFLTLVLQYTEQGLKQYLELLKL